MRINGIPSAHGVLADIGGGSLEVVRLIGGTLFFLGMVLMAWNVWKTIRETRTDDGADNLLDDDRDALPGGR